MNQAQVILYTTADCPYSWEARQYLRERGVIFDELLVDESELAARLLQQVAGDQVVPVTVVAYPGKPETVVIGFDRQRLDIALGLV